MNTMSAQMTARSHKSEKQDALKGVFIPYWGNWAFVGVIVTVIIALIAFGVSWGRVEQRLDYQDRDIRILQENVDAVEVRLSVVEAELGVVKSTLQAIANHLGVGVLE